MEKTDQCCVSPLLESLVVSSRATTCNKSTMVGWEGGSQLCDNNEGVSCCVPYRVTVTSHSPCKAPGRRPGVATDKVSAPRRHARPHFARSFISPSEFDKKMLKISKDEFSILRILRLEI